MSFLLTGLLLLGKLLLGILLCLVVLLLALLLLPFCAEFSWRDAAVTVRLGFLHPVFLVYSHPEQKKGWFSRWRSRRAAKRAAQKPAENPPEKHPRRKKEKAKPTFHVLLTLLQGAGRLMRAVFGALRITRIRVVLPVRCEEPDRTAIVCGQAQGWLSGVLAALDRFLYLDFDTVRLYPVFEQEGDVPPPEVSFRVSARMLFVVIAAVQVFLVFLREKVLDIFL